MESIPSTIFIKENPMDGTARYGSSSSSSSSAEFYHRGEKPVANQGKAKQKEADPDMDDWEFMEGDSNSPNHKKIDVDDGDWEFVEGDTVTSDHEKPDAGVDEWEWVEQNSVLPNVHKLGTSPLNADSGWPAADPSVSPADD